VRVQPGNALEERHAERRNRLVVALDLAGRPLAEWIGVQE
jgi:hypothetical protein